MDIENISYIVTSGVALAAIISPILSNWLTHRSQLRLKEIEFTYNNKLDAYNHWCQCASKIIDPYYYSTIGEAYLHLVENEYKALIVADKYTKRAILKYSEIAKFYIDNQENKAIDYLHLSKLLEDVMICMNNDIK